MPKGRARHPSVRSDEERNRLVEQYRFLPRWVAKKMMHNFNTRTDIAAMGLEEASAYGALGLIRAAELWDPDRNVQFNSYAVRSIWNTILRKCQSEGHLIHVPTHACRAGCPIPRRARAPHVNKGFDVVEPEHRDCCANCFKRGSQFECEELRDAMECLTKRERQVIKWIFGDGWKLARIAERWGITKQAVSAIKVDALKKLRRRLVGKGGATCTPR